MLAVLVFKTNFLDKVALKLGFPEDEIGPHYTEMLEYHKRMDANVPPNSIVFIGDSLIQGLYVQAAHDKAVNFGIGNDTVVGVLKRLPWYRSLENASAIVLQIGVNDLEYRTGTALLRDYTTLLAQLTAGRPVIVNALFPVAEEFIDDGRQWNQEIQAVNTELESLCATAGSCAFLDMSAILGEPAGSLRREMHIGDGVHLSPRGNAAWIAELRKVLDQVIKQQALPVTPHHPDEHSPINAASGD
ncbi:MAG: hypothetical protein KDJ38_04255 [Gammaproteobacteria bacterium]|nr:hypothetical protein [Gammaproteobacteria bacterium]